MAVATVQLARAGIVDGTSLCLALAAALGLLWLRVDSSWLVLGGAVAGLVASAERDAHPVLHF